MSEIKLNDKLAGCFYGSLLGDAHSLAAHWVYNPKKIERDFGRITEIISPQTNKYHSAKQLGEFTHYGDQTILLASSIIKREDFQLGGFIDDWKSFWDDYPGYLDGATKGTLENLEKGADINSVGSDSNDISAAGRLVPLVVRYHSEADQTLIQSNVEQTKATHADPQVIDSARFFALLIKQILQGESLSSAMQHTLSKQYESLPATDWVKLAREQLENPTGKAMEKLGLTCHVDDAFPAVIYFIEKYSDSYEDAIIENTMAGGDSAARGLLIGAVLGALRGIKQVPPNWLNKLHNKSNIDNLYNDLLEINRALSSSGTSAKTPASGQILFQNNRGEALAGRLSVPKNTPRAAVLFAHCFTCSKDIAAASRISKTLMSEDIVVLRFDFTGIGNSDGDFANTNFSSNIEDLLSAEKYLRSQFDLPLILVGHSLGGTAILAAATRLQEQGIKIAGAVSIAAPSDPTHVTHLFSSSMDEINRDGCAVIDLAGREFKIKKQFIEDLSDQQLLNELPELRVPLLIFHSPVDNVVSIKHAKNIFSSAKHPKSFISLDTADHLLTKVKDSQYVASMIGAWASRAVEISK